MMPDPTSQHHEYDRYYLQRTNLRDLPPINLKGLGTDFRGFGNSGNEDWEKFMLSN
jgi:hypothetical protein